MSDLAQRIARDLDDALAAYAAEAHGESVCRLHKEGRVTGGLKYEEGRVAALKDLERMPTGPSDEGVRRLLAEWQESLALHQARGRPLPWIAYAQGGVDALQRLHAEADAP